MKLNKDDLKLAGYGIGVIAILYAGNKILQKIGLVDDKDDKKYKDAKKNATGGNSQTNFWLPGYWQSYPNGKKAWILNKEYAEKQAANVYKYLGFWTFDNETAIIGIIKALKYKTQLSYLADVFYKKYTLDLFEWLDEHLSKSDMLKITNNADSKPSGWH